MRPVNGHSSQHGETTVKFKVMALAALVSLGAVSVQANELPDGPHIVTSGTASVDAVPDVATLAIEVNVAAKDAASAKSRLTIALRNISLSSNRTVSRKRYQLREPAYPA
jgi:hypothetical protein